MSNWIVRENKHHEIRAFYVDPGNPTPYIVSVKVQVWGDGVEPAPDLLARIEAALPNPD